MNPAAKCVFYQGGQHMQYSRSIKFFCMQTSLCCARASFCSCVGADSAPQCVPFFCNSILQRVTVSLLAGKQDMQQQGGASEHIPQEPAALPDLTAHKVHAVEMEDEALLQPAAPESKADAHAEGRTDAYSEELVLPQNSAGSTKARHGGSIYDMLVQEIKSLKLQQKQTPRQLAELHRNLSMYMEKTAAEMSALDQAMKGLQADLDLMQRTKIHPVEDSNNAVATLSDVDIDLRAVLLRLESMQQALHQVQHRVTAIVLLAIIAWLGVVVLTAPALGQLTWILWIPIFLIAAIGVVWLVPCIFRIFPSAL